MGFLAETDPDTVSVKAHSRGRPKKTTSFLASTEPDNPGFLKQLARSQAKNLPVYGGLAGAIIGAGTPATPVGGAMIGAGAGKALEQSLAGPLGLEPPAGLLDAYDQQANAASVQGATEGIPTQWIAPGMKAIGGSIARSQMGRALRPAMPLVRNFPGLVENALKQGASVNRWFGRGGEAAAQQVRRDATGKVVGLLRAATANGHAIDIDQVARPVIEAVEKKAGPLLQTEKDQLTKAVQARADDLLLQSVMGATQRSSKAMSPMMADELRKAAARSARSVLTQEASGIPATAIPDMDRLIAKGAGGAVKAIQGVRSARAAEQSAIGVSRAVREAEIRPAPPNVGMSLGPVHLGVGLPPGAASRMALAANGLTNPLIGPIIANLLRSSSLFMPGPEVK